MYLYVPLYLMSCTIKERGKKRELGRTSGPLDTSSCISQLTCFSSGHQPAVFEATPASSLSLPVWYIMLRPPHCCLLRLCVSLWAFFLFVWVSPCLLACCCCCCYCCCTESLITGSPLINRHNLLCLSCLYYKPNSTWSPESVFCFWVQIVSSGGNTLGTFLEMLSVILRESVPVCIYYKLKTWSVASWCRGISS